MRFIDYPDHLPRPPLPPSPETLAIYERLKEVAKRLNIKIEAPKRSAHSGEVIDCCISLHHERTEGPVVLTVLKNRPAKETP